MSVGFTVLGSSGFIGSHLAASLQRQHGVINCPDRSALGALTGDLGHVFYCIGIDNVNEDPHGAVEAHVTHVSRILRACRFESLTYLSSTRLYLNARDGHEEVPLTVDHDDVGRLYNATKLAGEMLCLAIDRPEIRVVRVSNVMGFAARGISFIPALINKAITTGRMSLWIDRASCKDYVAMQDVVELLPKIAVGGRHRLYNLASGENLTALEVVECIERHTGAIAEWRENAPSIRFPKLAIARVREEFGFRARSVLALLPDLCEAHKAHLGVMSADARQRQKSRG